MGQSSSAPHTPSASLVKLLRGPVRFIEYPPEYKPLRPPMVDILDTLPKELGLFVLTFIDEETISQRISFVNKNQNTLCNDPWLWQQLMKRDFPLESKPTPEVPQACTIPDYPPSSFIGNVDWRRAYFTRAVQWYECSVSCKGCNTTDKCRFWLDGQLVDVTAFLNEHPGGPEVLLDAGGTDGTKFFMDIGHSIEASKMAQKYVITPESFEVLSSSARFFYRKLKNLH